MHNLGAVVGHTLKPQKPAEWWLVPELKRSWVWERPVDSVKYHGAFAEEGIALTTKGRDIVRNLFSLEVGITALFSQRASFGLRYAGEINNHYWDQRGYLRLDGWF